MRSAAAPSPVRFSDFDSGPPRELGHQLDLRGPALRLPGDVDIFYKETAIGIGVSSAAKPRSAKRLSKRFVCCCFERRSK